MSVLLALHGRNSHPRLVEPGPSDEQLADILRAALRAPDHGRLRPWHFVVISGDGRERLGQVFEASLALSNPEASDAERTKARQAPLRAPLIIAGLLKPKDHPKIPRVEQVAAVASALHGALLAAEDLGFGGIWRTGQYARDPQVIAELGGEPGDEVIGFLYLGSREGASKPVVELELTDYVSHYR